MKKIYIYLEGSSYKNIKDFLLRDGSEHAVFLFATTTSDDSKLDFQVKDYYLVPDEETDNSSYDLSLTEESQSKIIKRAWVSKCSLIEIHSHPFTKKGAGFSYYDLDGFKQFVPHVWWRLKGSPYIALVFGNADYDALAWVDNPNESVPLTGIIVDNTILEPTNNTLVVQKGKSKLWKKI